MENNSVFCSECQRKIDKAHVSTIDNKPVCHQCLYGETRPVKIYPIGKVRTGLQSGEREGLPESSSEVSCIELKPSQKQFMYRLDEEDYLTIVYYLHKVTSV